MTTEAPERRADSGVTGRDPKLIHIFQKGSTVALCGLTCTVIEKAPKGDLPNTCVVCYEIDRAHRIRLGI